jgi:hypothetical protein
MLARDRPLALDPLAHPADRRAVFAEAHRRASGADPPAGLDLDRLLEAQSLGGEPLFLAMSGLLATKQGVGAALRLRADELALHLAGDELDHVGRFWTGRGLPMLGDPPLYAHLAAAATLVGGLPKAAALDLIAGEWPKGDRGRGA